MFKDTILAECADMIRNNETVKLLQMYKAGGQLGGHQQQKFKAFFTFGYITLFGSTNKKGKCC